MLVTCLFALPVLLVFNKISGVEGWPEGTYGIPMPKTGCPSVTNFEWRTGSRTQHTEFGSHASEDIHLAGIYADPTDKITQSFCMKTIPVRDGHYNWGKGQYCIYKKGQCPVGFKDGFLYWDDAAPFWGDTIQNLSGQTPDGVYDRNTRIFFCCRNDGPAKHAIELPTTSPFHLLKWGEVCQKVKGMDMTEEYVQLNGEDKFNLDMDGGSHPAVYRRSYPKRFTRLYYCYYSPEPENKTMQTVLLILYIIGGVIGTIIIILILMCIAQKLFSRNPKDYFEEHNMSSLPPETMLPSTVRGMGRTNTPGGGSSNTITSSSLPNGTGRGGGPPRGYHHRPNGTAGNPPPHNPNLYPVKFAPPSTLAGVVPAGSTAPPSQGMATPPNGVSNGGPGVKQPINNPGAFAMPAAGDIVESPEPQGDERTPMLPAASGGGAGGSAAATPTKKGPAPLPPSYKDVPEDGDGPVTNGSIHTPSEAGSPSHEASSPLVDPLMMDGSPVTIAGLRPVSHPPSYEDVLREDHRRHPGATGLLLGGGHGLLGDDDHFDARMSDSD